MDFKKILKEIKEEGNKSANSLDDVLAKIIEELGEVSGEYTTINGNKPKKDYDAREEIKTEIGDMCLVIFDYILRDSDNTDETINMIDKYFNYDNRETIETSMSKMMALIPYHILTRNFEELLSLCSEMKFRYYMNKEEFIEILNKKLKKWKSYKRNK